MPLLNPTASRLVEPGQGILAADESIGTMSSRLEAEGITASATTRRDYRSMLVTADGLCEVISGVILSDETFFDTLADGTPFPRACQDAGMLAGVKVDTGTTPLAGGGGATITEGLDGLGVRLADYASAGASFAKWRAVIDVATVSDYSLEVNAHALARYAALCQERGIVPIVEPEVMSTGSHAMSTCAEVTARTLGVVFDQLERQHVELDGIVLKPNMVTPGLDGPAVSTDEIAAATLDVLSKVVPTEVPGVAFLSGGHPTSRVCAALAAMNGGGAEHAWELTFSFGRALVSDALHTWGGSADNVVAAQTALLENCRRAAKAHPAHAASLTL